MTIYDRLIRERDDAYRSFQAKLVPNVAPEKIVGVRTPALRRIAKELFVSPERGRFLSELPHEYYEENL